MMDEAIIHSRRETVPAALHGSVCLSTLTVEKSRGQRLRRCRQRKKGICANIRHVSVVLGILLGIRVSYQNEK